MKQKTKNKDIVIGIDPGLANTGYGVIKKDKNNSLTCLAYGTIKTKPEMEISQRLELLFKCLGRLIRKYKPEIIAVEQLFFCKNIKTALTVGEARGVVLLIAEINKIAILEFTPLQVKQAVSAYGKAEKNQIQKMVKIILHLNDLPKPDDAADALAIAICAVNSKRASLLK